MLKKLKLLKKPLFQKRRWSCDFPPRKMPVALKHRAISRQEKMAFSAPVGLSWDSPPPPTECADGRTYRCTDVRTDGHVTITSQPKFLGLIGYHISLAMELRWRALPAGSTNKSNFNQSSNSYNSFCSCDEGSNDMNQSTAYELLTTITSNRLSDLLKKPVTKTIKFVYFQQLDFILIKGSVTLAAIYFLIFKF